MSAPRIPLKLDLTRHCIETEIRRRHEHCIRDYFKHPERRQRLETAIDLLREALETFDFAALRAGHNALAGHTDHRVALDRDSQDSLRILIDGQPLANLPLK
jgi:hypothetical protein